MYQNMVIICACLWWNLPLPSSSFIGPTTYKRSDKICLSLASRICAPPKCQPFSVNKCIGPTWSTGNSGLQFHTFFLSSSCVLLLNVIIFIVASIWFLLCMAACCYIPFTGYAALLKLPTFHWQEAKYTI